MTPSFRVGWLLAFTLISGLAARAQPNNWNLLDVGSPVPRPAATAQWEGDRVVLTGGGAGVAGVHISHTGTGERDQSYFSGGVEDAFGYLIRATSGNEEELTARLVGLDGPTRSQAGLMIRAPIHPPLTHYSYPFESYLALSCLYIQGEGFNSFDRSAPVNTDAPTGGPAGSNSFPFNPGATLPVWMKLHRVGSGVMVLTSVDGNAWTPRRWLSFIAPPSNLGLAVSAEEDGISATATFDNIYVGPPRQPLPAPDAPLGFHAATVQSYSVTLEWTLPQVAVDRVEIERSAAGGPFVVIAAGPYHSGPRFTDDGVVPNSAYSYRARALRGGLYSGYAPTVVLTTSFVAAPSGLTADTSVPNQVRLKWTDQASDEEGFVVEQRLGTTVSTQALPANATEHVVTGLSDNATYYFRVRSFRGSATSSFSNEVPVRFGLTPTGAPSIVTHPESKDARLASTATLLGSAGSATATYRWQWNGRWIEPANESSLSLHDLQPAHAGIYQLVVSDSGGSATSRPALLALNSPVKVAGTGREVGADIRHSNGNIYDQILMTGPSASVTANPGQIVRVSFLDLTDDIVQVEFSGRGTLTITLDSPSGPQPATNYNQPGVAYMKGHAGIVISDADATTHLSVFSVGRMTAVNQTLFRSEVNYDGVADIAFIAIDGSGFGGLRAANASFWSTRGLTGVFATGLNITGPIYVCDVIATEDATPVLDFRTFSSAGLLITGGDLAQTNGRPVQVSGLSRIEFVDGTTSHGARLPAQANRARFERDGTDVTAQMTIVGP